MADSFLNKVAWDPVLLQDRDAAMTKCVRRGGLNPELRYLLRILLRSWIKLPDESCDSLAGGSDLPGPSCGRSGRSVSSSPRRLTDDDVVHVPCCLA